VLNVGKVQNMMRFEPGLRAILTYRSSFKNSFEFSAFRLEEWSGKRVVHGKRSLSFPFHRLDYTEDYVRANKAVAVYKSQLCGAEANYWHHAESRRSDYFALSGIAGFRYFKLNESFDLSFYNNRDERSDYTVHTDNDMYGAQVGFNLQLNPTRWYFWDLTTKLGGAFDYAEQKSHLRDQHNSVTLRNFRHHHWVGLFFTDVLAGLTIHVKDYFRVRVGYEFMFFSKAALAPTQLSKGTTPTAGHNVMTGGHPIIHGLYAGLGIGF
jgi:hypothetical protein